MALNCCPTVERCYSRSLRPGWDEAQIVVQSLDSGPAEDSHPGGTDGRYLPTGHLVYALRGTVLAVPFDASRSASEADPSRWSKACRRCRRGVAKSCRRSFCGVARWHAGVRATGQRDGGGRTLVWVDRQGREETIAAPPHAYVYPRLAPDGTRLALDIQDDNKRTSGYGISRAGRSTRVTSDPTTSPPARVDTGRPAHHLQLRGAGVANLFWQAANGTGAAERLTKAGSLSDRGVFAHTMSPDGKRLVLREMRAQESSI